MRVSAEPGFRDADHLIETILSAVPRGEKVQQNTDRTRSMRRRRGSPKRSAPSNDVNRRQQNCCLNHLLGKATLLGQADDLEDVSLRLRRVDNAVGAALRRSGIYGAAEDRVLQIPVKLDCAFRSIDGPFSMDASRAT